MQLTATLRNLADLPQTRCQLVCSGAVSELCVALEQRMNDKDVCTYIVRIFRYGVNTVLLTSPCSEVSVSASSDLNESRIKR